MKSEAQQGALLLDTLLPNQAKYQTQLHKVGVRKFQSNKRCKSIPDSEGAI